MNIADVRAALKESLASIPELEISSLRDNVNPPCAIVYPDSPCLFDVTFDGEQRPRFCVLILVPYVDTDDAQEQMDIYLSDEGESSVKAAIEEDSTLGGVVDDLHVTELRSYGVISMFDGGTRYLSGELVVEVWV